MDRWLAVWLSNERMYVQGEGLVLVNLNSHATGSGWFPLGQTRSGRAILTDDPGLDLGHTERIVVAIRDWGDCDRSAQKLTNTNGPPCAHKLIEREEVRCPLGIGGILTDFPNSICTTFVFYKQRKTNERKLSEQYNIPFHF